jgi:hypothetical protein
VVARTVQRAHTATDWTRTDAALRFLGLLNPASHDTANWWWQQFRQLPSDVRRQLAPHTPAILAALADHPAGQWPRLVHQARTRTRWNHEDSAAQFLAALNSPSAKSETTASAPRSPAHERSR